VIKAAQRVIDKLKAMRATGEPVWISLHGWRLKIRPIDWDKDDASCVEALYKHKGRLHFGILAGGKRNMLSVQLREYTGGNGPPWSYTMQWNNVLAVVVEKHLRLPDEPSEDETK